MVINLLSLQIRCGENRSFPTSLSCWEASVVCRASSLKGVNCIAEEYNPKRHRNGCILCFWFCFFFLKREHLKSYRVITLVIVHAQSLSGVQLCDPMDCNPPGSSDHGIFWAKILEWVVTSYSRGSSSPRDPTCISCLSCIGRFFTTAPSGKPRYWWTVSR